jgi:holo-[acyl-carrier protein] synthase
MLKGLGIDLVETARLRKALASHGERFERRVFTDGERADCRARRDRIEALAARFAAKEACLKALGTGWSGGLGFRQVEVVRSPGGRPLIRLHGAAAAEADRAGVTSVRVSLTHQPGAAAAVVVLE